MKPRAASALIAASMLGSLALAGCGSGPTAPAGPAGPAGADVRPAVVTSTDVYGAVAAAVAGDRATVTSIITSPDADPHEYESTPKDALAVGRAQILVANGGGYDDFAGRLAQSAATSAAGPVVIDVSELSGLKAALPAGEEFNEHVWYDLGTVAKLADRLAAELGRADPADAAVYTRNATTFRSGLDGLNAKLTAIRSAHPGARVAVTEPVPLYLTRAAGLVNATPDAFAEAAELGNDPSAAVLNETLNLFRTDPVKALLANPQAENASTKQVEQAATAAGVPIVTVTETLPAGVTDYLSWMGGQIDQLSTAVDKR